MTSVDNASSSGGPPPVLDAAHSFLSTFAPQYPSDEPVASLRQNFPEDVESDVSSLSDRIPVEDYDETTGAYSYPFSGADANRPLKKIYDLETLKQFLPPLPPIAHVAYLVCLFYWNVTSTLADTRVQGMWL